MTVKLCLLHHCDIARLRACMTGRAPPKASVTERSGFVRVSGVFLVTLFHLSSYYYNLQIYYFYQKLMYSKTRLQALQP